MDPTVIIALVAGLVQATREIVKVVADDSLTPEQRRAALDDLEKRLEQTAKDVAAVQLPDAKP